MTFWGDGSPSRKFLYVEGAAEGILLAAEQYEGSLPVNLGTGEEIAICELATLIAAEVGFTGHIQWGTSKPNGQPRHCLDVSRATQLLGFQAQQGLREGLNKNSSVVSDQPSRDPRSAFLIVLVILPVLLAAAIPSSDAMPVYSSDRLFRDSIDHVSVVLKAILSCSVCRE